jgi:1,3-beta-galactosyl-N-acetylhexosamine phosphorylase
MLENPKILEGIDVILNVGGADTAHTGGDYWENEKIVTAIRKFIAQGGGFIGIGEPSGHQYNGHFFQLANALGVEQENGFTLGYDKYNWEVVPHFISEGITDWNIFGEGTKNIYALENTKILYHKDKEIQMAVNEYYKGRCVYMGGMEYNPQTTRIFHKMILWACGKEGELNKWFSTNPHVEVHYYPDTKKCAVCNNSYEEQKTTVYFDGKQMEITLPDGVVQWFDV